MNEQTTENLLVASADVAEARNGKKYLKLTVISEQKLRRSVTLFDKGDPTEFEGKVCSVTLRDQEGFPPKVVEIKVLEGADPSPFFCVSRVDRETAIPYLEQRTRGNEVLAKVADHVLFKNASVLERFVQWPAARARHHAFKGGLLEHTYCMARLAEAHLEHDHACQGIDRDIVMVAVALHDVGKVITYDWKFPQMAAMSLRGRLMEHIVLGDEMVVRACVTLDIPTTKGDVLHLRHCMLAHHGKTKWGSPVPPCTPEAVLVHQLDLAQSHVQGRTEIVRGLQVGTFKYDKNTKAELYRWR
jgi:3'-5' exoribonuclease